VPEPVIDRIARELEIGRWTMRLALYGDGPVVAHRAEKIRAAVGAIPGCELRANTFGRDELGEIEVPGEKIMAGIPNMSWSHITRWAGGESGGHIGFSPVVPLTGAEILRVRDLLRGHVHGAGMDYLAGLLPINARSLIHITMLMFDTENEAQTAAAYELARTLVVEAAPHGYGEYRAHVDFMEEAAAQYSFGDHAYRRFCETLKDALDPEGILSPGKNGIWPRRLRERAPAGAERAG
jgi:4-cresol dehydrogenase (hydroxylating)